MTPWITRAACWSAAGYGLGSLVDTAAAGRSRWSPAPYAIAGLPSPFAALLDERVSASDALARVVRDVLPDQRPCGLVVATTSGDITGPFEAWFDAGADPAGERLWRQQPALSLAPLGLAPLVTVSVACASGSAAFAIADLWLQAGRCERVIVAGVDVLSLFVHAGFGCLGALATSELRAFRADRDGLVLGEAAAAILLETPDSARRAGRPARAGLLGWGLSQDALHLTAPNPEGRGLERAARAALAMAGLDARDVDAVSAHATGTRHNDAMEALALARLFDGEAPAHAPKSVLGHTLGAAGVIEAALLLGLLEGAPPPSPPGPSGQDCPVRFSRPRDPRVGLSLNAAFGGVNAAVVLGPPETPRPANTARSLVERAQADLLASDLPVSSLWTPTQPRLGRTDRYSRAGVALVRGLREHLCEDTAAVLSSQTGCRAADLRWQTSLRSRGPTGASRLDFAYTIPGAPLAEASMLAGVRGPALVLCDEPDEGRWLARALAAQSPSGAVAMDIEAPADEARGRAVFYGAADR